MTDTLSFIHRQRRGFRAAGFLALAFLPLGRAQPPVRAPAAAPAFTQEQAYYNNVFKGMFPYLTPAQLLEFEKDLYPALITQPDLVSDGVELLQEGGTKSGGTSPEEGVAYIKKYLAYEARLRQAMMTQDKGVGFIFNQIDAHRPRLAN